MITINIIRLTITPINPIILQVLKSSRQNRSTLLCVEGENAHSLDREQTDKSIR